MLYTETQADRREALTSYFGHWLVDRAALLGEQPAVLPTPFERAVLATCRQRSIPAVNLVPQLASIPRWEQLYLRGDVHFNARGNRRLGEAIAAAVRGEP
jgi:hypothetical protein